MNHQISLSTVNVVTTSQQLRRPVQPSWLFSCLTNLTTAAGFLSAGLFPAAAKVGLFQWWRYDYKSGAYPPFWTSNWFHIAGGDALHKSLKLRRFKSELDKIWQDCSSSKFASIDRGPGNQSFLVGHRWRIYGGRCFAQGLK